MNLNLDGMIGLVARRDNNQTRYGHGDVVSVFMHEVGMLSDFEAGCSMCVGQPVWLARDGKIYNDRRMLEMVT